MTATDAFSDPDDATGDWIDVRMTDPEAGEWDVDLVVVDGRVQYVDLRIRRDLLPSFVDCLLDDASSASKQRLVERLTDERDDSTDETDGEETPR